MDNKIEVITAKTSEGQSRVASNLVRSMAAFGSTLGPLLRANGVGSGMYDRNTRQTPEEAAKAAKAKVVRKNKNKAQRKARRKSR